jgi:hypothetical protein
LPQTGWPEDLKKNLPNFSIAQKVTKPKKCQKYLQLRAIWKPKTYTPNHFRNHKIPTTAYLGEHAINLLQQKVAQNVTISLGYFIFSKNLNEPPKVAQRVKNRPIWSPWPQCR